MSVKQATIKKNKHRCILKCLACKGIDIGCDKSQSIHCGSCDLNFYEEKCFDEHLRENGSRSICSRNARRPDCNKIDDPWDHKSGIRCKNCDEYNMGGKHKCYIQKCEIKGGECTRNGRCETIENPMWWCLCCKTRTKNYIFYDFKTTETGDDREFVVNFVSAEDFQGNKFNFKTIDEFCELFARPRYKNYTFIAHNARAFDSHFIKDWFVRNGITPKYIYRGTIIRSTSILFRGLRHKSLSTV